MRAFVCLRSSFWSGHCTASLTLGCLPSQLSANQALAWRGCHAFSPQGRRTSWCTVETPIAPEKRHVHLKHLPQHLPLLHVALKLFFFHVGDNWTPPPDAWQPDEAPASIPHDAPVSGFEMPGAFPDSPAAAVDAAAAAPEVMTAVTATGLSAADLSMYPHHIFMNLIE